jgi:hypothetical protein
MRLSGGACIGRLPSMPGESKLWLRGMPMRDASCGVPRGWPAPDCRLPSRVPGACSVGIVRAGSRM